MMRKSVPDIELERKPTDEEQHSLRINKWQKSFTEALSKEWKLISVEDGSTRTIEERSFTSIIVTCSDGTSTCKFFLMPKEWDKKDFPKGIDLGINGKNSQGARYFILEGDMPKEVQEKVSKYFGLE
jgi:hypothetical protein